MLLTYFLCNSLTYSITLSLPSYFSQSSIISVLFPPFFVNFLYICVSLVWFFFCTSSSSTFHLYFHYSHRIAGGADHTVATRAFLRRIFPILFTMEDLKLASFNVNGINLPAKRRIIFDKIRNSKAQVALIQETHSTEATASVWEAEWGGKILFNHGLPNSRGVAVLFGRNFSPKIINEKHDDKGRILALDLAWGDEVLTLCCLYAPTQDKPLLQAQFMDNLDSTLDDLTSENIILGGDFNCILDPILDRNSTCTIPVSSNLYRNRLHTLMDERQLCDVMRVRNPTKRVYTFRRGNYASRLDLFLVSEQFSETASQLKTLEGPHSDHTLITIFLRHSEIRRGPGYWRFDSSLLSREDFTKAMSTFLVE